MNTIESIIKQLQLEPHPEGGFYRETYRSKETFELKSTTEESLRNASTCIYFLLTSGQFSAFHKIKQDEIWHFYKGSPVHLHLISPKGNHSEIVIGTELNEQQTPQFVVPAGTWFAAAVKDTESYSLVGCTVAPGFDFEDFELAKQSDLLAQYPKLKEIILAFTRN